VIIARTGVRFGLANPEVVHARPGRLDRASRLALAAAQAVFTEPVAERAKLGVWMVSQYGAFSANAEHWQLFMDKGIAGVSPLVFPATVPSAAAAEIAIATGAMGPNVTLCGGPLVALQLLKLARRALHAGVCDEALVGAVDGWHPLMAKLGLNEREIDGAVLVRLKRDDVFGAAVDAAATLAAFDALVTPA
jgi:3-oxoacyl-(acyl-carrier-protein) synthase